MPETTNTAPKTGAKRKQSDFRKYANGKVVFAFDFGEYSVKIAVLKIKRNGAEIRNLFTVENAEGLPRLDMSTLKNWRARIQRALSQRNLGGDDHYAVCTFGAKTFIHRQLEIPYVEEKDRPGLVESEMSQLLALETGAYLFQHEVIEELVVKESSDPETEPEKKTKVWAVAMPRDTCTAAFDLLRSMKFKPLVMDIHANGIRRFLTADDFYAASTAGQTVACLDYGMTHTEISFIRDGKLLGNTLLDAGDGRLVSEAINAMGNRAADTANPFKLAVSPEEVCAILTKENATAEERAFSVSIEDWLSKISTAISRFNFDHPDEPASRILIYGGSPQIIWLVQYIQMLVKLPADRITNTTIFETTGMLTDKKIDYSTYLNALSLALMD
ncbi:MAG: pilus assembly protein PilM [Lachnospiraceae bacterium]|nr:pilus assembly protein PilM [Lachnospiraceae bacterium]